MTLLETAHSFTGEIAERAAAIEQARQIPQDLADRMAEAGLYHLCVPDHLGGAEAHPVTFLKVVEALSSADGSTGWCVNIGATTGLVGAYIDEDAARTIFAPGTIVAGVFAPMGKATREGDHYRVNGRWNWGSGSLNAKWIMGGSMVLGADGKPEILERGIPNSRMMIVPRAEAAIEDSWHVMGLCGTGSNQFSFTDALVPHAFSVALATDRPRVESPLYAFPAFGLLAIGIAAVAIGIGQGALDEFVDLAGAKTPQYSKKSLANRPQAQRHFSQAAAMIDAARAFLHDAVNQAFEAAQKDGVISDAIRARLRLAACHGTSQAAQAVTLLHTEAGGTSVFLETPLQRRFRDVHVATQHLMVSGATQELSGRVLLGVETDTAML